MSRPQVLAYARGGIAYVSPRVSLGGTFDAYLQALGPTARFDKTERAHHVPLEDIASVVARLAGTFAVTEQDTLTKLREETRQQWVSRKMALGKRLAVATRALYPYQREGVEWLATHRAGLLADEMGLGKTLQALMAIGAPAEGSTTLIVCPAVAMGTWVREIRRWRPDLTPLPLTRKGFFVPKLPCVGIVSYDSLPPNVTLPAGSYVIADEAHYLKSFKTQRTQRFRMLSLRTVKRGGFVWLLTGTPLLNRPQELWGVLQAAALALPAFGSWERFVGLFGGTHVPVKSLGKWAKPDSCGGHLAPSPGEKTVLKWTIASPEVRVCLDKVMLRRKREDVLPDLPAKTWQSLPASLDAATVRECNALLALLKDGETIDALYARLSSDANFEAVSAILERLSAAKIPSLLEHVETFEDAGEPLVVFSAHRRPIEALKARRGWTTILGGDSAEDRASKVAGFMAGKYLGIAGTIQALGTSVTLTRACKALFVSRLWTPDLNAQAEDRVCRIGQDRGVLIYDLTSDHPLDARLSEVLRDKTRLVRSVL